MRQLKLGRRINRLALKDGLKDNHTAGSTAGSIVGSAASSAVEKECTTRRQSSSKVGEGVQVTAI